jgi:uncharacterized protein YndB with AHSA1/START domain
MKIPGMLKVTTPTDREIAMTRVFDAPRSLVFDAWTRPDLLKRWLYRPEEWRLAVCEIDLRVGAPCASCGVTAMERPGDERRLSRDRAARDAVRETLMEHGVTESYNRLAELLALKKEQEN